MSWTNTHNEAVKYAKLLMLPPEYVHYAESAFIAGSDFGRTQQKEKQRELVDGMKYDMYDSGTFRDKLHRLMLDYANGITNMIDVEMKLYLYVERKIDESKASRQKPDSVQAKPRQFTQLSLFD